MAENYSKGTRVWFPDKEQGWISAEVQSTAKGSKDGTKITFVDDRGKVYGFLSVSLDFVLNYAPILQEIIVDTGSDSAELPPLRNPPLLETADDLATLSHLNEPSGARTLFLFHPCS